MASNNERFTASIEINARQAHNELDRLTTEYNAKMQRLRAVSGKRSKEAKAEAEQLRRETNILNKQIREQKKYVDGLNSAMTNLSDKTYKDLKQEVRQLNKIMRDGTVKKNSEEWYALAERIKAAKREMQQYETVTNNQVGLWQRFSKWTNESAMAITSVVAGITGLSMTIRKVVSDYAGMEEVMADTRKYTGLTDEQVKDLNEDLKKMDTRTAREELNEMAGAAGRLGKTAKKDILEFVDAADKISVALGDDLGEGAVDQIGKLAMAFGEDDKMGLRGAMLATGSAINELAQNSSAQAGYLVDFTARVAGFGKQMGLTQAQIMGFGAVMDENMLRDEMASTAFGNMLTKMQTDTAKFAKIAGMDVKAFTKLLNEDANEAILRLADNIKRADAQTMMKMLNDMGLDGARAVGVLSTMADKIDDVRERQRLATEAYADGTSVLKEFGVMNNTVQAELDKAKNRFHEVSVELGEKLTPVVKYTISSSAVLVKSISALINFVDKYKVTLLILTATIVALNAKRLYGIAIAKLEVLWNERVAASFLAVGRAIKANPWGIAITAITTLVGLMVDFSRKSKQNADELSALGRAHKKASEQFIDESAKIEMLTKQVRNSNLSYTERKKALDELKKVVPGYIANLDEEKGLLNDNKEAITEYLKQLEKSIKMKAAQEELEEAYRKKRKLSKQQTGLNEELQEANSSLAAAQFDSSNRSKGLGSSGMKNLSKGLDVATQKAQSRVNSLKSQLREVGDLLQQNAKDIQELDDEINKSSESIASPAPIKRGGGKTYITVEEEKERKKALKKAADAAKASYQEQLAVEMLSYRQGITAYSDYMEEKHNLTQNYYDALKRIYGENSNEYKRALLQQEKDDTEYNQWKLKMSEKDMSNEKVQRDHAIRLQYAQGVIKDEDSLNEQLFMSDINYLKKKANLYKDGSKERMDIETEIRQKEQQHQWQLEENWAQRLSTYRQEMGKTDFNELMKIELKGVESFFGALVTTGKMTEEEYDAIIQHIKMKYADLAADQDTDNSTRARASKSLSIATKAAGVDSPVAGDNAATGIYSISQAVSNQKLINEQLKLLYGEDYENNKEYQEAKRQLDAQTMSDIVAGAQAAYGTINTLLSAASNYAQACSDVEVARIESNYEAQIEAAGKNATKKEELEKEKDKAIAKAKTAANKKAMKIEIAQATASTAMAAINAYSSAAAIPVVGHVLAPIAAAMAVAAGAIQIATIKKQHEAEASGYYGGGFTGGKQYRKEAGVVHEGEFVANHHAVNNKELMPMFQLLDQAQRNNRIGSLSAADVTNVLGGPASTSFAPVFIESKDKETREAMDRVSDGIDALVERLDRPFDARLDVQEFDKDYKHYQNLLDKK